MKTKLEMAHDYAIALINSDCEMQFDKFIRLCWNYADAMQAEAEKRTTRCDEKIEINMYPEWDASINYPPDSWVMYRGEKRLAVSIKEEWQPDWSQAPDWANWWTITKYGQGHWFLSEPKVIEESWVRATRECKQAPSFGYTGDWRDSLRKRPQ